MIEVALLCTIIICVVHSSVCAYLIFKAQAREGREIRQFAREAMELLKAQNLDQVANVEYLREANKASIEALRHDYEAQLARQARAEDIVERFDYPSPKEIARNDSIWR